MTISGKITRPAILYTKRAVIKTCDSFGEDIARAVKKNGGTISISQIERAAKNYLPKNAKVKFCDDAQKAVEFVRKKASLDTETAKEMAADATAFASFSPGKGAVYFVPAKKMSGSKIVNVATHEFEHLLFDTVADKKILLPNFIKRAAANKNKALSIVMQEKYDKLQNAHLSAAHIKRKLLSEELLPYRANIKGLEELAGVKKLHLQNKNLAYINENLIDNDAKKQIQILKAVRESFLDEARAYSCGGRAAKKYLEAENGTLNSQLASVSYKTCAKALDEAISAQRVKKVKDFFRSNAAFKPNTIESVIKDYQDARDLFRIAAKKRKPKLIHKLFNIKLHQTPVQIKTKEGWVNSPEQLSEYRDYVNGLIKQANKSLKKGCKPYKLQK